MKFLNNILEIIDNEIQDETLKKKLKEAIIKHDSTLRLVEHSWLQKNWRPLIMMMLAGMIVCNYTLAPILGFTPIALPEEIFQLMKIGLGVYITGRTIEKIVALKR